MSVFSFLFPTCSEELCALSYKILINLYIEKSLSSIDGLRCWCCSRFFFFVSVVLYIVDMNKVCNVVVLNAVRLHGYAIDVVKTTILYAAHASARWKKSKEINRCAGWIVASFTIIRLCSVSRVCLPFDSAFSVYETLSANGEEWRWFSHFSTLF